MAQQIKDPVLSQLWLGSQLWHRFHPWTLELRMRVCPPPKNLQMDSRTDKGIQGSYKNQVAVSDTTKCLTLYGSKWKKGWKEAMMNKLVKLELWICCDLHLYLLLAGWLKAVQVLMVLSLILCCLSFILFMFQLYTMRRGGLFYATGLCQLCTSKHSSLGIKGKGGGR